jgi:hypothetical protein
MIDLLEVFKRILAKHPNLPEEESQASFGFPSPPRVIFVKDTQTLTPLEKYDDIPGYTFSAKDQAVINKIREEIEGKGGYDGDQLLIDGIKYDEASNTLYLEPVKAKYSFLLALRRKPEEDGFDSDSPFFNKTFATAGVRVPFVTEDEGTFFLERTNPPKVLSVVAGHLEPSGEEKKLHPQNEPCHGNLVTQVAYEELLEEALGNQALSSLSISKQLEAIKTKIKKLSIYSVAIRRNGHRIEIEFIVPAKLNCNSSTLIAELLNSSAPDKSEHHLKAGAIVCVPLSASKRREAMETLNILPNAGAFVRAPIVEAASRSISDIFHKVIPGFRTLFFPIPVFSSPSPRKDSKLLAPGETIKPIAIKTSPKR